MNTEPEETSVGASNSSEMLCGISFFEKLKADYIKRYMARERVSLAMMAERETFEERCDWAVAMLQRKVNDA